MSERVPEGDGTKAKARSNLRLRVLSGLVLGVAALAATLMGGPVFRLFAIVVAALVFHEWMTMRPASAQHGIVARAALAAALAVMLAGLSAPVCFAALSVAMVAVLAHSLFVGAGFWSTLGIAYAGFPAFALAFLRGADEAGLVAALFLFAVVWATDIIAYFVGRAVGGPKLAPSISPGKTWSGALGGAVGGVVAGMAVVFFTAANLPLMGAGLTALLLSLVSQAGDLFESGLKRRHGVKDSGTLIPGHGGVMDRVDGLVAAALLLYVLGALYSGVNSPSAGFFSR